MESENLVDFNFWPAFADLMLATMFVLVLVIALIASSMELGSIRIAKIKKRQDVIANAINTAYGGELSTQTIALPQQQGDSLHVIEHVISKGGEAHIHIINDIQLQRITFSDKVLFGPNRYELTGQGQEVLAEVGGIIQKHLGEIYKITIEGHTDNNPTSRYQGGNLELGAHRALAVYSFLYEVVGIDPIENLMSATSFGEYKPVQRFDTQTYSPAQLQAANRTAEDRGRNRRVELLLFYRR